MDASLWGMFSFFAFHTEVLLTGLEAPQMVLYGFCVHYGVLLLKSLETCHHV